MTRLTGQDDLYMLRRAILEVASEPTTGNKPGSKCDVYWDLEGKGQRKTVNTRHKTS